MVDYNLLDISAETAEQIVSNFYNIQGKASKLHGEIDFNFRIKIEGEEGYILKISRPEENEKYLDFQQKLLQHLENGKHSFISPKIIKDFQGNTISTFIDEHGQKRQVRLLTWVEGRMWSSVNPQLDQLRKSLGQHCGKLTNALQGFDHPMAHRKFDWDIAQYEWNLKTRVSISNGEKENHFLLSRTISRENHLL